MTCQRRHTGLCLTAILAASVALFLFVPRADSEGGRRRAPRAPVPEKSSHRPENETRCNYQDPQAFMIRENYLTHTKMPIAEFRRRCRLYNKSVRYRTKNYGYFKGFGRRAWNRRAPSEYAKVTTFFGKSVRMNERIIPVLECVEQQIRTECGHVPYQPGRLGGIREKNTYQNHEVSNHVYGIAIDIDPSKNRCCLCGGRYSQTPICQRRVSSIYERMSIPQCWVDTFERFGFYWLGRDRQQDAMHFEFLGDPAEILRSESSENEGLRSP